MIDVRRTFRGLVDLTALLVVVFGIPALLLAVPGGLSVQLPTRDAVQQDPAVLLRIISLVIWPAWLVTVTTVAFESWARARNRPPSTVPWLVLQPFIRRRVAGVAMLLAGSWHVAKSADPPPLAVLVESVRPAAFVAPAPEIESSPRLRETTPAIGMKWIVTKPGDSLWDLADVHLGDGDRYVELVELNRGLQQPDRCCVEPPGDFIRPGWLILLPSDASGAQEGTIPAEFLRLRSIAEPTPSVPPDTDPADTPSSLASPPPVTDVPSTPPSVAPDQDELSPSHDPGVTLPSGSVVAASFASGVASAVILGRLRRRRRWKPEPDRPSVPVVVGGRRTIASLMNEGIAAGESDGPNARTRPPGDASVPVGSAEDGTEILVDVLGSGGVAITGPGSTSTLRALVAALLVEPDRFTVLTEQTTAEVVLGHCARHGLRVERSESDALAVAEVELATRARLMERRDAATYAEYCTRNPDASFPILVMVIAAATDVDRLTAIVAAGGVRGVTAVVASDWPSAGQRIEVSERLDLDMAGSGASRAFGLEAHEVSEIATAIAEAEATEDESDGEAAEVVTATFDVERDLAPSTESPTVRVAALGGFSVVAGGSEVRFPRSKSREALAFFILRPRGASAEVVMDALWPDVDVETARPRFWKALSDLRKALRDATGVVDLEVVEPTGGEIYSLKSTSFDADVWRFEAALAKARGQASTTDALEVAIDTYRGELFDGLYYEWAATATANLRSRALGAVVRLAELYEQAGAFDNAATTLERGIALDPFAEDLYARLIALQCGQGQTDAAKRTLHRLRTQLGSIGEDPMDSTTAPLAAAARLSHP